MVENLYPKHKPNCYTFEHCGQTTCYQSFYNEINCDHTKFFFIVQSKPTLQAEISDQLMTNIPFNTVTKLSNERVYYVMFTTSKMLPYWTYNM